MRKPDFGFAARETALGTYKFQAVIHYPSQTGQPMMRTAFPHAHLLSEQKVERLGYDTRGMIEQAQALRVAQPDGEAARRRSTVEQKTLASIEEREHAWLQEDIDYADEMINATALLWGNRYGDPDAMFPGVYPNVTDQYRDVDGDPDRYANMFIRDAAYRLSQHQTRPERRAEQKQQRQERRRERNRNSRRGRYPLPLDEYPF